MFFSKILLFSFWKYLSRKRKKQISFALFVSIINGLFEILTINLALPFLSILTNNGELNNYPISKLLSKVLNIPVNQEIYLPIIICFAISIIISTALRLLNLWLNKFVAADIGNDLNKKALSNLIHQPYEFHINHNSSKVVTANTEYINRTQSAIMNSLQLISNLILTLTIGTGIFLINPYLTIYSVISISGAYFLFIRKLNKKVKTNSKRIASANRYKVKYLQEVIGSIRLILLDSNQKIYLNNIQKVDFIGRKLNAQNAFIAEFPRFAIESIVLLLITFASFLIIQNENNIRSQSFIVILGTFTLGIQRLLPAMQRVYNSWINVNASSAETMNIKKILDKKVEKNIKGNIIPYQLKKSIKLESISFSYNKIKKNIKNINLEIFKGQKIGIIGKTGSGKSTLIDLIMGLLKPSSGNIFIDGHNIHDKKYKYKLHKWMSAISHVPQDIFLIDGTIAENIAFGYKNELFSLNRVIAAAKMAEIDSFIKSTSNGYSSYIGERGIKLSGGQRQRIGIARALYKKSKILILDEATSALDNETEKNLINNLNKIGDDITIISIAHRRSTLQNFERIIEIDKGSISLEENNK